MNIRSKIKKDVFLEIIKWVGSISLLVMSVFLNYMYYDYNVFFRRTVVIMISMVACLLLTTKLGKLLKVFSQESYVELKKVVWPTYQDTLNTTFVVVAVTVIISVILWGLDTVLVHVISCGLRL